MNLTRVGVALTLLALNLAGWALVYLLVKALIG